MSFLNVGEVQSLCGGTWSQRPADLDAATAGVSIDTRTIGSGEVFVAIRGERFDGHMFVRNAVQAGAVAVVVDEKFTETVEQRVGVIRVRDTVTALGRLANGWRRRLNTVRVVAVTGSNGKTSTVRMIDAVLGEGGGLRGSRAEKSFNNEIGVPLTVLGARPGDRYLVCEVGMNAPGEIVPLGLVCEPDVAVITTVGSAHVGAFTDGEEGVAKEKASLLSTVREGGLAVLNGDRPLLEPYYDRVSKTVLFGSSDACSVQLTDSETVFDEQGAAVRFSVRGASVPEFDVAGMGRHTAMNACAAIGVGRAFGIDDTMIARGLAAYSPPEMRLSLERVEDELGAWGVTVLSDCYNASPDSVAAALEVLHSIGQDKSARRIAVLGDMLELGDASDQAHCAVVSMALQHGFDLVCVGGAMTAAAKRTRATSLWSGEHLDNDACNAIVDVVMAGDTVLVKGSRAMGLERVIDAIRTRYGKAVTSSQAGGSS